MLATKSSVQLRRSTIQLVTPQHHTSEVSPLFPNSLSQLSPTQTSKRGDDIFSHVIVDWHNMNSSTRVEG